MEKNSRGILSDSGLTTVTPSTTSTTSIGPNATNRGSSILIHGGQRRRSSGSGKRVKWKEGTEEREMDMYDEDVNGPFVVVNPDDIDQDKDSSPTRASTTTNNNEIESMVGRLGKFHIGAVDGLKQKTKKDRKRIAKLEAEMRQSKEEIRQLKEQVQAAQEITRESKHSVSAGTTSGRGRVLKITPLDVSVPRATDSRTQQRNHPDRDAGPQLEQQYDGASSGSRTSATVMAPDSGPASATKRRGEIAEADHRGSAKRRNSSPHVAPIPPPPSQGPPAPMSPISAPRNMERRDPSPVPMDLDEEDDDDLPLHFERHLPPACAGKRTLGPFGLDELKYLLDMHEKEVSDIESLKMMQIPSFAVHISNDVAFVYEALTFEAATGSFLVNWGLEEAKMDFEKVFEENNRQVLYTFIHPTSTSDWWYLGALEWRASRLPDIWKRLDKDAKEDIQKKIARRVFKQAAPEAIGLAIDQGRLKQMCIQVKSGAGLVRRSEKFAREKRLDD